MQRLRRAADLSRNRGNRRPSHLTRTLSFGSSTMHLSNFSNSPTSDDGSDANVGNGSMPFLELRSREGRKEIGLFASDRRCFQSVNLE
jgi:hypothetical protein